MIAASLIYPLFHDRFAGDLMMTIPLCIGGCQLGAILFASLAHAIWLLLMAILWLKRVCLLFM